MAYPTTQDPRQRAAETAKLVGLSSTIPASAPTAETNPSTKPSDTNWAAFDKARLVPSEIVCQGYYPVHPHDASCHSRIKLSAESMIPHITGEHGNRYGTGFKFSLKPTDGKGWKGF